MPSKLIVPSTRKKNKGTPNVVYAYVNEEDGDRLLSFEEARQILNITSTDLCNLVRNGKIGISDTEDASSYSYRFSEWEVYDYVRRQGARRKKRIRLDRGDGSHKKAVAEKGHMTTREAAVYLGVDQQDVRDLCVAGKLNGAIKAWNAPQHRYEWNIPKKTVDQLARDIAREEMAAASEVEETANVPEETPEVPQVDETPAAIPMNSKYYILGIREGTIARMEINMNAFYSTKTNLKHVEKSDRDEYIAGYMFGLFGR